LAARTDIRIAVQRDHRAGDLLFDRCDVLTGDLEIRLGALIDRPRCPVRGDQRLLSGILTLTEVRGILCRLKLRQLLAVGGLERLDLETRATEPRLGLIDRNLVRFGIDPEQQLALLDALIVLNGDFNHLAGNPRVDRHLRCADERVVRRDIGRLR
jgi:hypothetical protein